MHALIQDWPVPCATQPIPHSPASLCWNLRHFYKVISGGKSPNNNGRRSRARETGKRKKDRGEKGTKGAKKQQTEGKRNAQTDRGGKSNQVEPTYLIPVRDIVLQGLRNHERWKIGRREAVAPFQ